MGRAIRAATVVLAGAALVWLLSDGVAAVATAMVGGLVAALLAADAVTDPASRSQPSPSQSPSPPRVPFDEVLDAVDEPVLLVRRGRVTLANRAARTLLGAHIVGEDARVAIRHPAAAEWLTEDAIDLPDRPVMLVGIGTLDQRWEMRIGRASDGQRIVHLVDQTGNDAAERMRVDFVANASHELRTPLASILGYVETLGEEAGDDPAIRARFLKVMFDEARRMQRLVEDLISLSRIEATKYRLPEQPVDLAALIAEVCAEIGGSGGARAADLDCTTDPAVPSIAGDRAQLSQMLHNLIGNALKYGRPATPVRVTLALAGGTVRLSVADHGEGIASEHIPRLTERFYRVDAGRSRSVGGTGLGLAIVKHIVERHRGRLEIASRVGQGTTVTILLPPMRALSRNGNADVTRAVSPDGSAARYEDR